MFIPIDRDKRFAKGNLVILLKNYESDYGMFTCGHKFKITKVVDYNDILLVDKDGHKLRVKSVHDITKDIKAIEAKEKHDIEECKYTIKNELSRSCPHRGTSYEDYHPYDCCDLKRDNHDDNCYTSFACVKYLPEKSLKKQKIITSLRKLKIKNLLQ